MPFGIIGRTGPGMRRVVGFGNRFTGMGTFGGEFRARHCKNGDFTVYLCDRAASRPSSQITLSRLSVKLVVKFICKMQALKTACTHYVNVIRCFAAITLTDANCTTKWVPYHRPHHFARGGIRHLGVSTLTECQKACEFDPRCVAVDWQSYDPQCWLSTNQNHSHYESSREEWRHYGRHYELVSRCNITSGLCFDI